MRKVKSVLSEDRFADHTRVSIVADPASNENMLLDRRSPDATLPSHQKSYRSTHLTPFDRFAELNRSYKELEIEYDSNSRSLWCYLHPEKRPSFTPTVLRELISLRRSIQDIEQAGSHGTPVLKYFVGGSRVPGIYSMGGDFQLLIGRIRAGDRAGLLRYAHDCIDVAYHMWIGFDLPIITIALVQGDALGGGFEGALASNVLVAERGAKFGLPEILFKLFPGMGAYSFLSRKLDSVRAERMIMSGRIYSAEELHNMGLVDVLAENGQGEAAVRDYISRHHRRHAVQNSIYQVRRRVNPLSFDELRDITEIWVEAALRLTEVDLRKMDRLMSAQIRRVSGTDKAAKAI